MSKISITFFHTLLLLCIIGIMDVNAQSSTKSAFVGEFIDNQNQVIISQIIDPDYYPKNRFKLNIPLGKEYAPAFFYTLRSHRIKGMAKHVKGQQHIRFKQSGKSSSHYLGPETCNAIAFGVDSLVVIDREDYQKDNIHLDFMASRSRYFARLISDFDSVKFYSVPSYNINVTVMLGARSFGIDQIDYSPFDRYFIEMPGKYKSGSLVDSSKQLFEYGLKGHKDDLMQIFSSDDYILELIASCKEVNEYSIMNLLRIYQYNKKLKANEPIYYDKNWLEVDSFENCSFYLKLLNRSEMLYNVEAFNKKGETLFRGAISFYNKKMDNVYLGYLYSNFINCIDHISEYTFADGKKRKSGDLIEGEEISNYHIDGSVHYQYHKEGDKLIFSKVIDPDGNPVLDANGTGTEVLYDSIRNRNITREFSEFELTASYYNDDNGIVYQFCDRNPMIKSWKAQQDKFVENFVFPESMMEKHIRGNVVVRLLLDNKGRAEDIEILKGYNDEFDQAVLSFFQKMRKKGIIQGAKHQKMKVRSEYIFSIDIRDRIYSSAYQKSINEPKEYEMF